MLRLKHRFIDCLRSAKEIRTCVGGKTNFIILTLTRKLGLTVRLSTFIWQSITAIIFRLVLRSPLNTSSIARKRMPANSVHLSRSTLELAHIRLAQLEEKFPTLWIQSMHPNSFLNLCNYFLAFIEFYALILNLNYNIFHY